MILPQSPPCAAYRSYPNPSISLSNTRAVSSIFQSIFGGAEENAKPGCEGTTTWNA